MITEKEISKMSRGRRRRARMYKKQDGLCFWCSKLMKLSFEEINKDPDRATFDHIVPVSKGGANAQKNLVLSCNRCNSHRGNEYVNPHTKKPFVSKNKKGLLIESFS